MKQPMAFLVYSTMLLGSWHQAAASPSPDEVTILTDANFKPSLETGNLWFVEFYAVGIGRLELAVCHGMYAYYEKASGPVIFSITNLWVPSLLYAALVRALQATE
jgi:hypothetical protein